MVVLPQRYNVRVYGLCLDPACSHVLVTDERRGRVSMTKFPGGGNELGEGLSDTLRREFLEELGLEIEVMALYYINDFLQISAFNSQEQLLSVYYFVRPIGEIQVPLVLQPQDLEDAAGDFQAFRWLPVTEMGARHFTFPIDQTVAEKIYEDRFSLRILVDQGNLPRKGG